MRCNTTCLLASMLAGNTCAFTPMRLKKSIYVQNTSTMKLNQSDSNGEEPLFYDDFDMGNSQSDNLYNPQGSPDTKENIDYTSIFQRVFKRTKLDKIV